MKNIFILLLVIFVTFIGVYAVSANQKGAILENFKKRQYDLLFESDLGNFNDDFTDIFNIRKKVNLYQNIGNANKQKIEAAKKKNNNIENKITSLEDSLEQLDLDIKNTLYRVNRINENVIKVKKEYEINIKTITILKKKIAENTEILLEYLIYIYKKGNTVYQEKEIDNLKSILLNEEDISDIINDLYFKGIIQITGKKLIDNHKKFVSELYIKKIDLEKQEKDLKKLRRLGIIEKKVLSDKKKFKEKILKISKGQQSFYAKYIKDKIKVEKGFQKKVLKEKIKFNAIKKNILKKHNCTFVDISKNTTEFRALSEECLSVNKMLYSESKLEKNYSENGNFLAWPIPPVRGVSTYYHDAEYTRDFGSEHDAMDIRANQGTPIKAPSDGYVIYIAPPISGDYAYIAIKHHNGYITVYGHISDVFVSEFDYVRKGEVFAETGGGFGTKGAGYLSTGPHLHFELFKDKVYMDPLLELDSSYIRFSNLPEKYKFKYYKDFRARRGYEYKNKSQNSRLFVLKGDTEIERQKYLLNTYAVGSFNNWQMWVEESLDGGIDPSFVMCVGLAETTLGKYLKTPYNIGNIGNTDSGATTTFPNARSGVYWMVKTFNNRYLGQYNSLNQLSRYGNKDPKKPIYASSPDNWHKNIIKCLSHIKGDYIPDDFYFRVID